VLVMVMCRKERWDKYIIEADEMCALL
jgi:hypothetical protein